MGTYSYTGTPVFVTISTTGLYDITAYGAQGGGFGFVNGGLGAEASGDIMLVAGEVLEIIVGGLGGQGRAGFESGGGGGGTFVLEKTGPGTYVPLVVAGGGGGSGAPGEITSSGLGGYGGSSTNGAGGTVGSGGGGGHYSLPGQVGGGGGGGITGNGGSVDTGPSRGGVGGSSALSGGAGGAGGHPALDWRSRRSGWLRWRWRRR